MLQQKLFGDYLPGETLGRGAFACVRQATHVPTNTRVALKILWRQALITDAAQLVAKVSRDADTSLHTDPEGVLPAPRRTAVPDHSLVSRVACEIRTTRRLRHPHIVRLFDVHFTPSQVVLVQEFAGGGDLHDHVNRYGRLPEAQARAWFQQLAGALAYAHSRGVAHRDVKPENILLDAKRQHIKLADFGLAAEIHDGRFLARGCGTLNYAPPEVIRGRLYVGSEMDSWACGVVLYVMLTGRLPFDDSTSVGLHRRIREGQYARPSHVSDEAVALLRKLLCVDPLRRPSLASVLQDDPWVAVAVPRHLVEMHLRAASELDPEDDVLSGAVPPVREALLAAAEALRQSEAETRVRFFEALRVRAAIWARHLHELRCGRALWSDATRDREAQTTPHRAVLVAYSMALHHRRLQQHAHSLHRGSRQQTSTPTSGHLCISAGGGDLPRAHTFNAQTVLLAGSRPARPLPPAAAVRRLALQEALEFQCARHSVLEAGTRHGAAAVERELAVARAADYNKAAAKVAQRRFPIVPRAHRELVEALRPSSAPAAFPLCSVSPERVERAHGLGAPVEEAGEQFFRVGVMTAELPSIASVARGISQALRQCGFVFRRSGPFRVTAMRFTPAPVRVHLQVYRAEETSAEQCLVDISAAPATLAAMDAAWEVWVAVDGIIGSNVVDLEPLRATQQPPPRQWHSVADIQQTVAEESRDAPADMAVSASASQQAFLMTDPMSPYPLP